MDQKFSARYVLSWSELRSVGKSKVINLSIIVPVLGYLILFNEQLVQLLNLSSEFVYLGNEQARLDSLSDTGTRRRILFLYFGLSFLGIGAIFFNIRCPKLIKLYSSDVEYVRLTANFSALTYKDAAIELEELLRERATENLPIDIGVTNLDLGYDKESALDQGPTGDVKLAKYLTAIWRLWDSERTFARFFSTLFYVLGFGLIFVPTIEVFVRVIIVLV